MVHTNITLDQYSKSKENLDSCQFSEQLMCNKTTHSLGTMLEKQKRIEYEFRICSKDGPNPNLTFTFIEIQSVTRVKRENIIEKSK